MTQNRPDPFDHDADAMKPSIVAAPFAQHGDMTARQVLDAEAQALLYAISEELVVPPHTVLYTKDSEAGYVYNIVSGAVATYELYQDGTRCISAFLFPHDLVGLSEHGRYVATAVTLNEVRLYKIPLDSLTQILRGDPTLSVGLLLKVCHDLRDAQYHAIVVSHNAAHRRVAGFLLWLSDALQMRSDNGAAVAPVTSTILLPMTRHDIADYLGLSAESISRALQLLETEGAILRSGARGIDIVDREKLVAVAAGAIVIERR